jgi:hypothetical protein
MQDTVDQAPAAAPRRPVSPPPRQTSAGTGEAHDLRLYRATDVANYYRWILLITGG